jgi:hypothetical protein
LILAHLENKLPAKKHRRSFAHSFGCIAGKKAAAIIFVKWLMQARNQILQQSISEEITGLKNSH